MPPRAIRQVIAICDARPNIPSIMLRADGGTALAPGHAKDDVLRPPPMADDRVGELDDPIFWKARAVLESNDVFMCGAR